jgi:hypothetical protein
MSLTRRKNKSMEQSSSWGADNRSAGQEYPHDVWNTKAHYHFNNNPPLELTLSQTNPIHIFISNFLTPILILSYHLCIGSSVVSFLQVFWLKFWKNYHLSHACYIPRPFHPPKFEHSNIWWALKSMKLFMQFPLDFLPLSKVQMFSSALCPQTFSVLANLTLFFQIKKYFYVSLADLFM